MAQRWKYGTNSIALLVIVLGILGIVNYLSAHFFGRLDLTHDHLYTVSPSTKQILSGLDDALTIKAYFSKDLPAPHNFETREIVDLLQEYQTYGKGNIKVEVVDPAGDPKLEEELKAHGIYKLPFQVRGASEFGIKEGYLALRLQYRDKNQVFTNALAMGDPQNPLSNLEYTLTSSIAKLSSEKTGKVGFFLGAAGEEGPPKFDEIRRAVSAEYELENVDFSAGQPAPEGVSVLVVLNPARVSEHDKYELDQFLMRGGKLIFLLDGVNVIQQYMFAMPKDDNLDDLLKSYGIKREHDLVMDVINERVAMRQGSWSIFQAYPLWVKVNIPYLRRLKEAADSPITNPLDSVVLPWPSSVAFEGEASENRQPLALLKTSPDSWVQTGQFKLSPQELPPPLPVPGMGKQVRDLALLVTGTFPSFYAGKPVPAVEAKDKGAAPPEAKTEEPARKDLSEKTSILIVGNARFISDDHLDPGNSNDKFLLNALDWMILGGKLIDIRSRGNAERPLDQDLSAWRFWTAGLAGPFLVPIGIIIFGFGRSYARKRSQRRYADSYSGKAA
jgi:ABC-2 type transport system permease protein